MTLTGPEDKTKLYVYVLIPRVAVKTDILYL